MKRCLCLACSCETLTKPDGSCKICGHKKESRTTMGILKLLYEKRVNIPAKKEKIITKRYDAGEAQAIAYAKTIRTAKDIPYERGPM